MKTDYFLLPDGMEVDEVAHYFDEFLSLYHSDEEDKHHCVEELLQLAERQWHTYEVIRPSLKERVEKFLIDLIDYEDPYVVGYAMSIIGTLGLDHAFEEIVRQKPFLKNQGAIDKIDKAIKEFGATVSDPYSSLR
ncbi:MAG: hypothetical protein PHE53_12480 [Thermoguttaceae bacterium]|nr:hypothetical protein [Thermoguttaceae bacterium]